jgi:excisionase family DNA binding protein
MQVHAAPADERSLTMRRTTPRLAFSPQEVAEATSLSLRTVMKAIASRELPSLTKGRRRLILAKDLKAYMRSRTGGK